MSEVFFSSLSHQPCVVVIDGLDCVTSRDGQLRELEWLLQRLPAHVRLVMSTCRSDVSFFELDKRDDVQVLEMEGVKSRESQVTKR